METKIVILLASSTTTILLILLLAILRTTIPAKTALFIIAGTASAISLTIILFLLIRCATSNIRHFSIQRCLSFNTYSRLQFKFFGKVNGLGLPAHFTYKDLQTATDNFTTPIGRGAFGSVFRGILYDGTVVAVKRIDCQAVEGDNNFNSEIAVIAGIHHVNLVRLLGYCLNSGNTHRFLVYKFAPNGSLEKWIFNTSGDEPSPPQFLPWATRVRVAKEVAKALTYLHHNCESRVLHLDVKPENILLDEDFHALVADFGLSKMMGRDKSGVFTTFRGTKGYLAPEWLQGTGVNEKADIYSYEMVLLEMVGGRRNCLLVKEELDNEGRKIKFWSYFPAKVAAKVKERRVMEVVDERMELGEDDEEDVRRLVYVALWCIQEDKKMRPSMERVLDMLEGKTGVLEQPPETNMMMMPEEIEGSALALQRMPEDESIFRSVDSHF